MKNKEIKIYLVSPRGFCAGVDRAIEIVKKSIKKYGKPVYVRHEIVHNKHVVENLKKNGAIFIEELNEIEDKSRPVIFSAHGVPKSIPKEASKLNLEYIDATCPLVSKVHREAENLNKKGFHILLIGHKNHPEVIGTMGQLSESEIDLIETVEDAENYKEQNNDLAFVTQTTLSVDDTKNIIATLKKRFPNIKEPAKEDICYATQNRQEAVKSLSTLVDLLLVVGANYSSNSLRLRDFGEAMDTPSYLIANAAQIDDRWLQGVKVIGLTAGASAPETLVEELINYMKSKFIVELKVIDGKKENISFNLPKILQDV